MVILTVRGRVVDLEDAAVVDKGSQVVERRAVGILEEAVDARRRVQESVGIADGGVVAEAGDQLGAAQGGRAGDVELVEGDPGGGAVDIDPERGVAVEADAAGRGQLAGRGAGTAGGDEAALVDEAADAALAGESGAASTVTTPLPSLPSTCRRPPADRGRR